MITEKARAASTSNSFHRLTLHARINWLGCQNITFIQFAFIEKIFKESMRKEQESEKDIFLIFQPCCKLNVSGESNELKKFGVSFREFFS